MEAWTYMLRGIQITLIEKVESGRDDFNAPIYAEIQSTINDVIVAPANTSDVNDTTDLTTITEAYNLYIPKGDAHEWRGAWVEFGGKRFRVVGTAKEYIETMLPLRWNKQVQVARYE